MLARITLYLTKSLKSNTCWRPFPGNPQAGNELWDPRTPAFTGLTSWFFHWINDRLWVKLGAMMDWHPDRPYPTSSTSLCRPPLTTNNHVCGQTYFEKCERMLGKERYKCNTENPGSVHLRVSYSFSSKFSQYTSLCLFIKLKFDTTIIVLLIHSPSPHQNNRQMLLAWLTFWVPLSQASGIGDTSCHGSTISHYWTLEFWGAFKSTLWMMLAVSQGLFRNLERKYGYVIRPEVLNSLPHFRYSYLFYILGFFINFRWYRVQLIFKGLKLAAVVKNGPEGY